jgi:hypothetical protein
VVELPSEPEVQEHLRRERLLARAADLHRVARRSEGPLDITAARERVVQLVVVPRELQVVSSIPVLRRHTLQRCDRGLCAGLRLLHASETGARLRTCAERPREDPQELGMGARFGDQRLELRDHAAEVTLDLSGLPHRPAQRRHAHARQDDLPAQLGVALLLGQELFVEAERVFEQHSPNRRHLRHVA